MIVPAVIAKSQEELDEMLEKIDCIVNRVMLDIMDGEFVDNNSLDFDFSVKKNLVYEAHLMVKDPGKYIIKLKNMVNIVAIHVESATSLDSLIENAKNKGMQVYLALNPETPIDLIRNKLSKIDGVLIMTVKPGKYGSKFLPETLDKVREIRKITPEMNIEVDGGMNPANVRKAREAGANVFASGSFILKSSNPSKSIKKLEKAARIPYP